MRYIVASARYGSFSAAAHEFNVRQPIVSKRIKEAEQELGVRLFERSTAGARLTPIGEDVVAEARRILDAADRLTNRVKVSSDGKSGRLVVGFYKSLSAGALRAFLREFRETHTEIDVELIEAPYKELIAGLHTERIDAAIVLGDAGQRDVVDIMTVWSERLVVALPKDHSLAERSVVYWPELKGERFLISHHDPGPDIGVVLLQHLAAPSDHPEIVTCQLSRESIVSEVGSGRGISVLCECASGLTGLGAVFRPVHDGNGATRLGYIVCWKPDNPNPLLATFRDALKTRH